MTIACKRVEVDFSYSPTEPRAGQAVTFSNLSSAGEEWSWSYGDGVTSTLKSPSHTYKKPGKYRVVLKVDNKSSRTATHEITVYDTVPTFSCADTAFTVYRDYTFTANLYNPYNLDVKYQWGFPANTIYVAQVDTSAGLTGSSIKVYFLQAMEAAPISLRIVMNGDTTYIDRSFPVADRATNSVLFRTAECDYRQRIFGARAEMLKRDETAGELLDITQDTMQVYNGYPFTLSEFQTVFPEIEGFHIAHRKIYFRAGGLWVANIDGANMVPIDEKECYAMELDYTDNRIYWANDEGVWYMPFIGSDNNKFVTTPKKLNNLTGVTRIAADPDPQ